MAIVPLGLSNEVDVANEEGTGHVPDADDGGRSLGIDRFAVGRQAGDGVHHTRLVEWTLDVLAQRLVRTVRAVVGDLGEVVRRALAQREATLLLAERLAILDMLRVLEG